MVTLLPSHNRMRVLVLLVYISQLPHAALPHLGRGHRGSGGWTIPQLSVSGWVCSFKCCGAVICVNQAADPRAASHSSSTVLISAATAGKVPVLPCCSNQSALFLVDLAKPWLHTGLFLLGAQEQLGDSPPSAGHGTRR